MRSDSVKNMSAYADQNHAPSLAAARLEFLLCLAFFFWYTFLMQEGTPKYPAGKKRFQMNRHFSYIIFLLLCTVFLSGCKNTDSTLQNSQDTSQPLQETSLKLNTVVTITIYDSQDQALLDHSMALCDKYEKIFSRTLETSELYQLNHRKLPHVDGRENSYQISQSLADLIATGLSYSEATQGAFDIAIAPLTSLWDFTSENPIPPEDSAIHAALSSCGYQHVNLQDQTITFDSPDIQIDLGAVAKGYISDRIKEYLVSQGVESGIINLGGNVLCIGKKPDGTPFKIGIQKPFADHNETEAIMDITNKSVVSSGIYERCFQYKGKSYHHILNPKTGYPYQNGLISVTIVCDQSVMGDALSTSCFALGLEEGLAYAESLDNVQAVFITDDYKMHYTKGFQKEIPVTDSKS